MVTVIAQSPIRLRITEIFHSLQGETSTVGIPTVFVRLTGCPLRCQYCDTAYAFHGGEMIELPTILDRVASFGARYVTVTGGEPLAQPACLPLLERLCDAGYVTSLETSGALDISRVDPRVIRVVDLKTPGSRESARNRWENVPLLTKRDQVKFVICNVDDYAWARAKTFEHDLPNRVGEVLFSPSHTELPAAQLAEWILRDRLPVRMQIQLHKVLWGNEPGR
jgi:7-carboxy-7-deazaguanine synthase